MNAPPFFETNAAMPETDQYHVPAAFGEALLVEKRSKFIARVWPARTEDEALARLEETRKKHWDANHNVYAYILRGGPTRCSDDGEPHGTSGIPTLKILQGKNVFNACCVVTRYFGGTLLGAGGLARAYSAAAKLALEAAGLALVRQWHIVLIPSPYSLFERLRLAVLRAEGVVTATDFAADILIEAMLPPENAPALLRDVDDIGSGRIKPEIVDTVFGSAP